MFLRVISFFIKSKIKLWIVIHVRHKRSHMLCTFLKSRRTLAVNFHLKSYEFCYIVKSHTIFSKLWPKQEKNRQNAFYSQNDSSRCCNKRPNWHFLSSNCQSQEPNRSMQCVFELLTEPCAKINHQISSLCWIILSTQSFAQMNPLKRAVTNSPLSLPAMMGCRLTTSPMHVYFLANLKSWQQNRQQECSRRSRKGWSFSLDTLERYNCGLNYEWLLQAQETLSLSRLQEHPSQYLYALQISKHPSTTTKNNYSYTLATCL